MTLCLFGFRLNNTFCLGNILLSIPQNAFAIPLLDELKIRGSLVFWNREYKRGFFSHLIDTCLLQHQRLFSALLLFHFMILLLRKLSSPG